MLTKARGQHPDRRRRPLTGTIPVSGAKNAALPILCAALLSDGESTFRNVPDLRDIETTAQLLRHLGREVDVASRRSSRCTPAAPAAPRRRTSW